MCSYLHCRFLFECRGESYYQGIYGEVTCKARLLFALADLPAKAALYNIIQFNGKYGCPHCVHEGEQVAYVNIFCVVPDCLYAYRCQ